MKNSVEIKNGYVIQIKDKRRFLYIDGNLHTKKMQISNFTIDLDNMVIGHKYNILAVYDDSTALFDDSISPVWSIDDFNVIDIGAPVLAWNKDSSNKVIRFFGGSIRNTDDANSKVVTYSSCDEEDNYKDTELYDYCKLVFY